jgi:diacylglycerol kinase family enzyme
MRSCFIINPQARNGRSRERLRELSTHLERLGLQHDTKLCEGLDHAFALSQEANRSGYDLIVAVGGDGTINRVLNGFFDPEGRRIAPAKLGVIYTGTSPDFCRSYGIPLRVLPALETLLSGVVRQITVGRIVYAGGAGASVGTRSACFACCANIGLGAPLARLANQGIRKHVGDFLGTLIALLRVLAHYRPCTLQLALDGECRTVSRVHNVSVGRTFHVASGIKVRHQLEPQDARFYVVCVKNLSFTRLGPVLYRLYSGRPIPANDCLSLEHARTIALASGAATVEVEFDGDAAGRCPCRIEAAPTLLDLMVERVDAHRANHL